jgi:NADH-ubiquinone oxidoreductase chain 5
MEGPTPVSALIHAATMVTAGIFLIIRCSPMFEYSPDVLKWITIVGALTAFFAATVGLVQNDIKKIIAYSTCSQLGYMTFICGLSHYSVSLFHLSNHAFFKALLFLSAGSIIHSLNNEQDIRKMGGLLQLMPFTYSMFLIGSLSLAGFPFLSGFYSKDVILEIAYTKYSIEGLFAFWLGSITAFFTALYSIRLLHYVFFSKPNGYKVIMLKVHEAPFLMALPLSALSILSIFSGYLTKDLFIGLGSDFFIDSIFIKPENLTIIDSEFIPFYIKLLPTTLSLLGSFLGLVVYSKGAFVFA